MGTSSYYRAPGQSDREHFAREWDGHFEIVDCATSSFVFYAAVRRVHDPEAVTAIVVKMYWDSDQTLNFSTKVMGEDEGPYYHQCPERILDLLTDTDNEYALEWRRQCRSHLERRAVLRTLKAGDPVRAPEHITLEGEPIGIAYLVDKKRAIFSTRPDGSGRFKWKQWRQHVSLVA